MSVDQKIAFDNPDLIRVKQPLILDKVPIYKECVQINATYVDYRDTMSVTPTEGGILIARTGGKDLQVDVITNGSYDPAARRKVFAEPMAGLALNIVDGSGLWVPKEGLKIIDEAAFLDFVNKVGLCARIAQAKAAGAERSK